MRTKSRKRKKEERGWGKGKKRTSRCYTCTSSDCSQSRIATWNLSLREVRNTYRIQWQPDQENADPFPAIADSPSVWMYGSTAALNTMLTRMYREQGHNLHFEISQPLLAAVSAKDQKFCPMLNKPFGFPYKTEQWIQNQTANVRTIEKTTSERCSWTPPV